MGCSSWWCGFCRYGSTTLPRVVLHPGPVRCNAALAAFADMWYECFHFFPL